MSPSLPENLAPESALDLRLLSQVEWDSFVNRCASALLFHTSNWQRLLTSVYDIDWHPLGVWLGDQVVGLFPLLTRRLGPFRLAGSPLMQVIASTPFMGPLVAPAYISSAIIALDHVLRLWKINHIEIAFPTMQEDLTGIEQLGYSREICQTVVLNLEGRTPDQLWMGLSSSCRRAVRRARSSGVQVAEAHDPDLDEYYRMCRQVYRGSGRLPHLSDKFYSAAWDALSQRGEIKVLFAKHAGQIIAGGIFLVYRNTAYYLSGASCNRALRLRPNNLIQWHFIEWAAAQGCNLYDLGGARIPGITRFKLSFGGQIHSFTRLYRANSMLTQLGRAAYGRTIPRWRRLFAE